MTGLDTAPETADVKGVVLGSDLPATGDLTTSNGLINQLVRNIRWGMRGNFLSIPTDTPARDERLGWTGDINVFAPAACRYAVAVRRRDRAGPPPAISSSPRARWPVRELLSAPSRS